jgi:hypothetical protein
VQARGQHASRENTQSSEFPEPNEPGSGSDKKDGAVWNSTPWSNEAKSAGFIMLIMPQIILCVLRRQVTDPMHRSHMALWRNGSASDSSSLLWSLLKVSCSSQLRVKEALCFCIPDNSFLVGSPWILLLRVSHVFLYWAWDAGGGARDRMEWFGRVGKFVGNGGLGDGCATV